MPFSLRRLTPLLALSTTLLLVACDGEEVSYDSNRYEPLWTRTGGSDTTNATGVYGDLKVSDSANWPGARNGAVTWVDSSGTFWLFGGDGHASTGASGEMNDLWKLTATGWQWVSGSDLVGGTATYGSQGVADDANTPGARQGAIGWADSSGNLWLFGGRHNNSPEDRYNDLWKFDTTHNQWTWVGGANTAGAVGTYGTKGTEDGANWPGSRYQAGGWVGDTGKLWLFGGFGNSATTSGWLNDLWVYDPAVNKWTWKKGSNVASAPAVYATAAAVADDPATTSVDESKPAVTAADITPGGRQGMASWHLKDLVPSDSINTETAWVFGGVGNDAAGGRVTFNELWRFDGTDWVFMRGTQNTNSAGSYGGRGVIALTNDPPSRARPVAWVSGSTLWMFGGAVQTVDDGDVAYPNDLWRFDSIAWTWVGGSNNPLTDSAGDYPATLGSTGRPAGREQGTGWVDGAGGLWLFGGGSRNDFWSFVP